MSGRKQRFSNQDIWLIRRLWDNGLINTIETAKFYGCGAETIRRIGRRETYGWLPPSQEELDEKLKGMDLSKEEQAMLAESAQRLYQVSQDRILGNLQPVPIKEALKEHGDESRLTVDDLEMLEKAVKLGADRNDLVLSMLKDGKYAAVEVKPVRVRPPNPMDEGGYEDPDDKIVVNQE